MTTQPANPGPVDPDVWEALARYVAGESAPDEAEAMRRWLEAEPARAELVAALDRSVRGLVFQPPADLDAEAALRRVSTRLNEPVVRELRTRDAPAERAPAWWRTTAFRIAAAIVLLLGGALVWRATREATATEQPAIAARTFETGIGETDTLRLSDGSLVLLGPASRLVLGRGFGNDTREVELRGEALFDVVHDNGRPFTVRAGRALIEDLGTTFTVRGDEDVDVRVVVTSGSVRLQAAGAPEDASVVLRAGDRGIVAPDGRVVAQPSAATDDDLAWTRGRLVFEAAPIQDIMDALRRWYAVEVRLADSSLAGRHVTTTFERESLQEALDILALTLGARIERRGDTAVVHALPVRR